MDITQWEIGYVFQLFQDKMKKNRQIYLRFEMHYNIKGVTE